MKRHLTAALLITILVSVILVFAVVTKNQSQSLPPRFIPDTTITPVITYQSGMAVSAPLTEITPRKPWTGPERVIPLLPMPSLPAPVQTGTVISSTAVQQTSPGAAFVGSLGLNFDGQSADNFIPPDTNGAVGTTQYVQWVNITFAIYDKSGGLQYGPADASTIWAALGGPCGTYGTYKTDPYVQFDQFADRWVMTILATDTSSNTPPFSECIAVSQSSDATSAYNLYSYTFSSSVVPDYPKLGIWVQQGQTGAYYITYNMFTPSYGWIGANLSAYDRNAMINGQPAQWVSEQLGSYKPCNPYAICGSVLPASIDGTVQPDYGTPDYEFNLGNQNQLGFWYYYVDFSTNPPTVELSQDAAINTASFVPTCSAQASNNFQCVAQPYTTQTLDALSDRLMYRAAYRRFSDGHESIVLTHSIQGTTGQQDDFSGIRWYELRTSGEFPYIYQQGTYVPDTNYRWMGSIAQDQAGDIAVGFSLSSNVTYPAIWITGRTPSDALGTMEQETNVILGTAAQIGSPRWGDYSSMAVDPVDGCTFWYTNEYQPSSGDFNWHTRIATFNFPSCP